MPLSEAIVERLPSMRRSSRHDAIDEYARASHGHRMGQQSPQPRLTLVVPPLSWRRARA
jgi:hypothetical protein